MHFDFITPKGLKITPSDGRNKKMRDESKKRKIRVEEKQNRHSFNF